MGVQNGKLLPIRLNIQYALIAIHKWFVIIEFQVFISKSLRMTMMNKVIHNLSKPVDIMVMTSHVTHKVIHILTKVLRSGALRRAAKRGSSKRRSRSFGLSLCLAAFIATNSHINAYAINSLDHYKLYLHSKLVSEKQYKCAYYVAHIESRWRTNAVNGAHYGLFQMRNDRVKHMNAYQQIDMWVKYVNHRYNGKACKAMSHLKLKGWQ